MEKSRAKSQTLSSPIIGVVETGDGWSTLGVVWRLPVF